MSQLLPAAFGMSPRLWRSTLAVAVAWTAFMAASLAWLIYEQHHTTLDLARLQAQVSLQKDTLFRLWGTAYGGVYVWEKNNLPSNLRLSHGEESFIKTTSGQRLMLVSPMSMMRQVQEMGREQYGHHGRLTSLRPLNPENAPDAWEAVALKAFEMGQTEVSSVESFLGRPHMRVMRPVATEKSCLECHGGQGLRVGDLRSGVKTVAHNTFTGYNTINGRQCAVVRQEMDSSQTGGSLTAQSGGLEGMLGFAMPLFSIVGRNTIYFDTANGKLVRCDMNLDFNMQLGEQLKPLTDLMQTYGELLGDPTGGKASASPKNTRDMGVKITGAITLEDGTAGGGGGDGAAGSNGNPVKAPSRQIDPVRFVKPGEPVVR